MSIHSVCKPRQSVFAQDRRATVLNLDAFLRDEISGKDFFDENYFTNGMLTLVDRAFRHLSGSGAGSSVFLLSQADGRRQNPQHDRAWVVGVAADHEVVEDTDVHDR